MVFTGNGEKYRNKVIKDYINVSVVVDTECGDTNRIRFTEVLDNNSIPFLRLGVQK